MSEIAYIFSEESTEWFNKLPSNLGRVINDISKKFYSILIFVLKSKMIHSLIKALGLFNFIR